MDYNILKAFLHLKSVEDLFVHAKRLIDASIPLFPKVKT